MFIKVGYELSVPMGRGWVFMENIQKIVEDLSAMRQDMIAASERIYIVNAGRMNHGKSSLLNSILGREAFRVADVRETRVNQEEPYKDDVFLVDTPGLDADETDDQEAFAVYKKANFIIFVHNPKIGEFHRSELQNIGRMAKMVGEDYFWRHFALALTFQEEFEEEELSVIGQSMKAAIKEEFHPDGVPLFIVSNMRYERSQKESDVRKKQAFLERSGIPQLREFLQEHLAVWRDENLALQEARFEMRKAKAIDRLAKERDEITDTLQQNRVDFQEKTAAIERAFHQAYSNIINYKTQLEDEEATVAQLGQEVWQLQEQWKQEREDWG
mgnify:FL=1